uniref:L0014-like protein n=1 Tax=Escherichia coli TaxID=562 RepID=Q6EZC0_ECOLX|nr:L0014-like protein [Escherichia coli]
MISLPYRQLESGWLPALLICVNPSTVWVNRYNMCWMRTPSPVTCLSFAADGVTRLKSCGLMLMVCACSPNVWRKANLSGLRCVTVRYPLPARAWQCSSINWTGVTPKHPALMH